MSGYNDDCNCGNCGNDNNLGNPYAVNSTGTAFNGGVGTTSYKTERNNQRGYVIQRGEPKRAHYRNEIEDSSSAQNGSAIADTVTPNLVAQEGYRSVRAKRRNAFFIGVVVLVILLVAAIAIAGYVNSDNYVWNLSKKYTDKNFTVAYDDSTKTATNADGSYKFIPAVGDEALAQEIEKGAYGNYTDYEGASLSFRGELAKDGYTVEIENNDVITVQNGRILGLRPGISKLRVHSLQGVLIEDTVIYVHDSKNKLHYTVDVTYTPDQLYTLFEETSEFSVTVSTKVISGRSIEEMNKIAGKGSYAAYAPMGYVYNQKGYTTTYTDAVDNEVTFADAITKKISLYFKELTPEQIEFKGDVIALDFTYDTSKSYDAITKCLSTEKGTGNVTFYVADNPMVGKDAEGNEVALGGFELAADGGISATSTLVGQYTLTVKATDENGTYATKDITVNIVPKPLSVSLFIASNLVYNGTDQKSSVTPIVNNLRAGDDLVLELVSTKEDGTAAEEFKQAGKYFVCPTIASGAQKDCYTLDSVKYEVNVATKPVDITYSCDSIDVAGGDLEVGYNATAKALTATINAADIIEGDVVAVDIGATGEYKKAGEYEFNAKLNNPNYSIRNASKSVNLIIGKISYTVTYNNITDAVYGTAVPKPTVNGVVITDAPAGAAERIKAYVEACSSAVGLHSIGTHSIGENPETMTCTGYEDVRANYRCTSYTKGTLTVIPKPLKVNAISRYENGDASIYTALDGYTVEFADGFAPLTDEKVVFIGDFATSAAGTGVAVSTFGIYNAYYGGNYTLAQSPASGTIIARAVVTITAPAQGITKVYDDNLDASTAAIGLSGVATGDNVGINTSLSYPQANVGSDLTMILGASVLTGRHSYKYKLSDTYPVIKGAITPKPVTLSVKFRKTYDNASTVLHYEDTGVTFTGLLPGYEPACDISVASTNVKRYTGDEISRSISLSTNYSLSFDSTSYYEIKKATLTLQLSGSSVYDGSEQTLNSGIDFAISGLVGADTVTGTITTEGANVGRYGSLSKFDTSALVFSDNYSLAVESNTYFEITPKPVTLSISKTKTYDGNKFRVNYGTAEGDLQAAAFSGFLGTDANAVSGYVESDGSNATDYQSDDISVSNLRVGANYIVMVNAGSKLTITAKPLTLKFTASKEYDRENFVLNYGDRGFDSKVFFGLVAGDESDISGYVRVNNSVIGNYNTALISTANLNVGSNYSLNVASDCLMKITARKLVLSLSASKVYDAGDFRLNYGDAGLRAANFTGLLSGDEGTISGYVEVANSQAAKYATAQISMHLTVESYYDLSVSAVSYMEITKKPVIITLSESKKHDGTGFRINYGDQGFTADNFEGFLGDDVDNVKGYILTEGAAATYTEDNIDMGTLDVGDNYTAVFAEGSGLVITPVSGVSPSAEEPEIVAPEGDKDESILKSPFLWIGIGVAALLLILCVIFAARRSVNKGFEEDYDYGKEKEEHHHAPVAKPAVDHTIYIEQPAIQIVQRRPGQIPATNQKSVLRVEL